MKVKVALGLSGGVDSAVSAYLLKEQGFDVSCVYLNCYDSDTPGCRGDNDRKDALEVAMNLGLPFQVLDFRKEYQAAVIDYFKKEYLLGRTPNPDVICNRDIKFGLFLDWAIKAGFDYIATGHYAKMVIMAKNGYNGLKNSSHSNNSNNSNHFNHSLLSPADLHKDQTYFLWAVPGEKFKKVLFPLGDLLKTEVREIALKIGLPVAKKKDSTGICFVGEVRVEDFLKKLGVKEKRGEVVVRNERQIANVERRTLNADQRPMHNAQRTTYNVQRTTYRAIGSHRGVWFYTIGQRHGFSVDQWPPKNNTEYRMMNTEWKERLIPHSEFSIQNSVFLDRPPLYVIEKDIKKNRLIVGFGAETYREKFVVSDTNWLVSKKARPSVERPGLNKFKCLVRIRHGGELIECTLTATRNWQLATGNLQSVRRDLRIANNELPARNAFSVADAGGRITVRLSEPQRGVAPGQSAVFYSKEGIVLGGGIIQ